VTGGDVEELVVAQLRTKVTRARRYRNSRGDMQSRLIAGDERIPLIHAQPHHFALRRFHHVWSLIGRHAPFRHALRACGPIVADHDMDPAYTRRS